MTILTYSKSYDDPAYRQPDPLPFPALTGASALSQKFTLFTQRQIKSLTLAVTTSGTSSDVVQVVVQTNLAVALVNSLGSSLATSTANSGTATSTLTLLNVGTFGSGATAPQYLGISGGTFNCTLVQGTTTTTATNAVIPQGLAAGGISVSTGDQFWIKKGTDATVSYIGEIETFFTPGTNFTL